MPRRSTTQRDDEFLRELGGKIAASRVRSGKSRREVAAARGYSHSWLQKIESGENQITALDLIRVAEHLRVPVEFLLGRGTTLQPETVADFRMLFPENYEAEAHYAVHAAIAAARHEASPFNSEVAVKQPTRTIRKVEPESVPSRA